MPKQPSKKPVESVYKPLRANPLFAGECDCLGWCNKRFFSPDKRRYRYCKKCQSKKDAEARKMSNILHRLER